MKLKDRLFLTVFFGLSLKDFRIYDWAILYIKLALLTYILWHSLPRYTVSTYRGNCHFEFIKQKKPKKKNQLKECLRGCIENATLE